MIIIDKIAFSYPEKRDVFDSLDLTLSGGNIYGLLGKNGAGKSTLLKLIAGLLFPAKGNLDVLGFRPSDRYPNFLREIFILNEEFFLPSISLREYTMLYSPFYPRFNEIRFEEYLHGFGLDKNQKLSTLSYGQKKNFLLSFGLATDCKVMILDEPTNGLDIPSKSQFRKIVANAIDENRTFIISTHQARDMENLIDPIIILDEGQIVFFEHYESISKKLTVSKEKEINGKKNVVYAEPTFGGYTVVRRNDAMEETNINLEILFNAVVHSRENVNEVFKQ
ncbi:MAG: ABC transporter ATP-binding protein [Chryseolinea sp.]